MDFHQGKIIFEILKNYSSKSEIGKSYFRKLKLLFESQVNFNFTLGANLESLFQKCAVDLSFFYIDDLVLLLE